MSNRAISPFTQTFDKLPRALPIFPLANALLLPTGHLPLNIFEPRYLNMIEDAMAGDRLIGMIQPKPEPATIRSASTPTLFETGCAGRITDYAETHDGRLEIVLSGLCRFTIISELSTTRGYRLITPDWAPFEADYEKIVEPSSQAFHTFKSSLEHFLKQRQIPAEWDIFEKLDTNSLICSLVNVLPIDTNDRQMLLEADSLDSRIRIFTAILDGNVSSSTTRH